MRRLLLILFLGLFSTQLQQALADSDYIEGYMEQDVLQSDRTIIYSKDGRRDGYLKTDNQLSLWVSMERTSYNLRPPFGMF